MVDDIVSLFYYGLKEAVSSSNLIHSLVKTVKFLNLAVKVKEKIKTKAFAPIFLIFFSQIITKPICREKLCKTLFLQKSCS